MINKENDEYSNCLSTNPDIALRVLKTINEKHIKPKPKCVLFLIELSFWIISSALVIMASLMLSVFIYTIFGHWNSNIVINTDIYVSNFKHFLYNFFWIIMFLFIALLAYINFLKTKYSHRIIILATRIVVVVYILLGLIFYYTKCFECVHNIFLNYFPFYHRFFNFF